MVENEYVWLTQDMIATLYDKGRSTVAEYLLNIFYDDELEENSVCRKYRRTAADGKEYNSKFYNLEAVIAVGFRTNSERAIIFRSWAGSIMKSFSIRGYVSDKERLKNGIFLNKLHFAIHGKTAAELIVDRANAKKIIWVLRHGKMLRKEKL